MVLRMMWGEANRANLPGLSKMILIESADGLPEPGGTSAMTGHWASLPVTLLM